MVLGQLVEVISKKKFEMKLEDEVCGAEVLGGGRFQDKVIITFKDQFEC